MRDGQSKPRHTRRETPSPLVGGDPHLRVWIPALEGTDEDFVFEQSGRQHDVLHRRAQLRQQRHARGVWPPRTRVTDIESRVEG